MVLYSLLLSARAADEGCYACCQAGGLASCNAELRVYGEGSRLSREGGSWRIVGLWEIGCGGQGVFNAGATVALDHPPLGGELVMQAVNPLQVHCFQQACAVPATTCVSPADDMGRFFLLDCQSDLPVDGSILANVTPVTRVPNARVVVVDGRPLVVTPVTGNAFAAGTRNGAQAPASSGTRPATTTTYGTTTPAYTPPTPAPPTATYTPPAPVPTAQPSAPPSDPMSALAATLPADPPDTCKAPGEAVRGEARKRVDSGDERRMRKDALGALQEYRAALSMDVCNAYAWNGIGDIASEALRPDLAVRALRNTTRLLPGHYGAWTMLGKNYEALRQSVLAAEAYSKALELRPGLPEALDGWRRTAAP
ncbi:MAG: hypothetical protein Q8P41_06425 [Pseudomonadota bacterium]|nr:hypothetical protein [Pseudomonadota bacterium]